MAMIYEKNRLYMVPLAELQDDPRQPRKYMDPVKLEEMTVSVKRVGIIQPVICRQDPATSRIYNICGRRRCAAARLAGLTEVPAIFIDGDNSDEVALLENVQREDLNLVDEAEALQLLMENHGYQQEELATVMGKSQPTISKVLSINRLPEEIRDACRQDPSVPQRVLFEIARKKQDRSMLTAFRKYQEKQVRIAARENADGAAPAQRKRTKAEAMVYNMSIWSEKIGDLEFPDYSAEDRAKLIEAMNAMKDTLDETIPRAMKNKRKPV